MLFCPDGPILYLSTIDVLQPLTGGVRSLNRFGFKQISYHNKVQNPYHIFPACMACVIYRLLGCIAGWRQWPQHDITSTVAYNCDREIYTSLKLKETILNSNEGIFLFPELSPNQKTGGNSSVCPSSNDARNKRVHCHPTMHQPASNQSNAFHQRSRLKVHRGKRVRGYWTRSLWTQRGWRRGRGRGRFSVLQFRKNWQSIPKTGWVSKHNFKSNKYNFGCH